MGPLIILDKSAVQGLSAEEELMLSKHYSVVVPPILPVEILGDLKKPADESSLSQRDVQIVAGKLEELHPVFNIHYAAAAAANLLGHEVPMTGQAVLPGGECLRTDDGRIFHFFEEAPEQEALRRWHRGEFTEAESLLAERWREASRAIDLEGFKRQFQQRRPPEVVSVGDLLAFTDALLSNPSKDQQITFLSEFCDDLQLEEAVRTAVFDRWMREGMPLFQDLAPYAFFCYRVNLTLRLGLVFAMLSTRATNRIDLEYLYYIPFGMVGCSGDKFHQALWPVVATAIGRQFVGRDVLKADLKWLAEEWNGLSPEHKRQRAIDYGHYPPQNEMSVTHQLWVRFMIPWCPGSGNRALTMSEEEEQRLRDHLRPFREKIQERDRQKGRLQNPPFKR